MPLNIIRSLIRRMWGLRQAIAAANQAMVVGELLRRIEVRSRPESLSPLPVAEKNNLPLREVYAIGWRSFYSQSNTHRHKVHISKSCELLTCSFARTNPALSEHVLRQCLHVTELLVCARCTRDPMSGIAFDS